LPLASLPLISVPVLPEVRIAGWVRRWVAPPPYPEGVSSVARLRASSSVLCAWRCLVAAAVGHWDAGAGAASQQGDYRMAGSSAAEIMARAQEMAAGPALSANEEQAAKAKGWR